MKHYRIYRILLITLLFLSSTALLRAQAVKLSVVMDFGGYGSMITPKSQLPEPYLGAGGYGGGGLELRLGRVIGLDAKALFSYQKCFYAFMSSNMEDRENYYFAGNDPTSVRQYLHFPVNLQLWMGEGAIFEVGLQHSILHEARYETTAGSSPAYTYVNQSYNSVVVGFKFNMGRVAYLNLKGTYSMDPVFTDRNGNDHHEYTAFVGLGFRLFTTRKSAFR